MDNSFFAYLQQLELMAFFSGYPLLYILIHLISGNRAGKNIFKKKVFPFITFAYALIGTLYLGLQIRNLYPDYSIENIRLTMQQPWLTAWGLLSILFWIPILSRKPVLSLVHSLVFFSLLVKDLFLHTLQTRPDKNIVRNGMKIYSDSILLNLVCLIAVVLIYLLLSQFKQKKSTSQQASSRNNDISHLKL